MEQPRQVEQPRQDACPNRRLEGGVECGKFCLRQARKSELDGEVSAHQSVDENSRRTLYMTLAGSYSFRRVSVFANALENTCAFSSCPHGHHSRRTRARPEKPSASSSRPLSSKLPMMALERSIARSSCRRAPTAWRVATRTTSEHMHLHWSRKGVGSRRSELRNAPASVQGPRTCRGTVRFLKFLHALLGETELGLLTLLVIAQELLRWRPAPCSCLSVLCRPACRLSRSRSGQEQSIEPGLRAESDRA